MSAEHDQPINASSEPQPAAPPPAAEMPKPVQAPAPEAPKPEVPPQAPTPPKVDLRAPQKLDSTVEAEIEAAMAEMNEATGEKHDPHAVKPSGGPAKAKLRGPRVVEGGREHRTGLIVSVGATDIFVEFGPKELGVVEVKQYEGLELPKVGDNLEVIVLRYDANESIYICSRPGAVQKADWENLVKGQTVEARVTGSNKGGLECEVAGHSAFMPASQVDINHIADLSVFIGEKLPCVIQRVDKRGRGNIVLSRREVLAAERAEAAKGLHESLKEGDTIEGIVRKIMDFGAFIDLGGVDGLVHLTDLTHERVNHGAKHVAKFVTEGSKVTVKILKLDWDNNRIGLGLKQLQADPYEAAASEIVEGAIITGKVIKLMDFGAFVEVAPGVEGLIHISEIDWKRIDKVSDVLQPNEVIQVKVLKVDSGDHKISLSLKQTKDAPEREGGGSGGGGGGRGRGGGGGGRGRGRGGQRDDRSPDEILKETTAFRKLREQAAQKAKQQPARKGGGGLGSGGGMGLGLGDLKL